MSDGIDFGRVGREHVVAACGEVLSSGAPTRRRGRSTFLVFEDHRLPAKYVLGLAYQMATGTALALDEFTGGEATARVLRGLGFHVDGPGSSPTTRPRHAAKTAATKATSRSVTRTHTGKTGLHAALKSRFGDVKTEVTFPWLVVAVPARLAPEIAKLRDVLRKHRGFSAFDTPGHRLRCDFFLPDRNAIIEVDERQHYTKPRALALRNYPPAIALGFDRTRWIKDCERIAATDPSPPHRDEQRAFYDSLRDLLPPSHGMRPTIRVCEEDLDSPSGILEVLERIATSVDERPIISRVVVKGPAGFGPLEGERFLLSALEASWPSKSRAVFLVTPGGFLKTRLDERWHGSRGWSSQNKDINAFVNWAEAPVQSMLTRRLFSALDGNVRFLSVGSDVFLEDGTHAELVFVVDVAKRSVVHWTGKSYPTSGQARTLVQVVDLDSHLVTLAGHRVMVLGCHDLNLFSARARANQDPNGVRRRRCDAMAKVATSFAPTVVLQHPHSTDTPNIWRMPWACLLRALPSVKSWASGICYHNPEGRCRAAINEVLEATRSDSTMAVELVMSSRLVRG